MPEAPYKSVAVAAAFSPRFAQVLAEGRRMAERFGARLSLVYVGERTAETEQKFHGIRAQLGLPADAPVLYQTGDPATAILTACRDHGVDLIVAGALEKEVVLRPFLGDVARRLVRESHCSVALFTRPELEPRPLRRMVFLADHSEHSARAFRQALALASAERTERLYVVRVYTAFDQARATLAGEGEDRTFTLEDEEMALEKFILAAGPTEVPIEARCLQGNTGWAASEFVQAVEADLLMVPVASASGELSPRIAWITDVIPCNLWVIR